MSDELTTTDKEEVKKNPLEKLNVRQMKFFVHYLKTGKRIDSYKKAFNVKNDIIASVNASRLMKKFPEARLYLYEKFNLGEDALMSAMGDALKAEKQILYKGKEYIYPDHYARLKAVKLIQESTGQGTDQPKQNINQLNVIIKKDQSKGVFEVVEGEQV